MRLTLQAAGIAAGFAVVMALLEFTTARYFGDLAHTPREYQTAELVKDLALISIVSIILFAATHAALRRIRDDRRRNEAARAHQALTLRSATAAVMAGSIGHDLNNYLTVVVGTLELLARSPKLDDADKARIAMAREALDRTTSLSRALSSAARTMRADDNATIDVQELVHQTVMLASRHRSARGAQIRFRSGSRPVRVHGSESLLGAGVLNLILNGLEANEGRRDVTKIVEVRLVEDSPDALRIEVHDNGPGVPLSEREKIVTPFFTTKPTGTGLGLPGVVAAAEDFGGHVKIGDSDLGGARITMVLPLATA